MKTISLFIIGLLLSLNISAENYYTIFRTKGEVKKCSVTSQEWVYAARRDTVKLSDKIIIPEGGEIRILASATGIIYTYSELGETDVKHIIEKSKESLSNLLGAVTGELYAESESKLAGEKTSRVHGATSRGNKNNDYSFEKKLANNILKGDSSLHLELIESDDSFNFKINSSKKCRICIVCLLPGSASLCIPAKGILINKGETVLNKPEVFPTQESNYHVFKVNKVFNEAELCRILLSNL